MDRRFLLAIVLSVAVLLVFQMWFAPKPPQEERGETPVAVRESTSTAVSPPALTATEKAPPAPAGADTTRAGLAVAGLDRADTENPDIVIQTDLYRATFTNRGAKLTSWELLRYDDPSHRPVQLVRGAAELDMVVEAESGRVHLGGTLFAVRREEDPSGKVRLVFEAGSPGGLHVVRTYTFTPGTYLVDMEVQVSGVPDGVDYRLVWEHGVPPAEANPRQYERSAGTIVLLGKRKETVKPGAFGHTSEKELTGNVKWAGVRNKYFAAIMVPPQETSSRVIATGSKAEGYTGVQLVMPILRGSARHAYKLYLGPIEHAILKKAGYELDKAVDLGWKLFRPLSQLLLEIMVWMYGFLPNYGLVIIIISALTKFLFYPLTRTSVRSMKAMQQLQPKIQELKEKYKNDAQRQQAEMMALYKKYKVNPMGGCLPMLVQMPVFIALYAVLGNSITMRGANFMLWMNDLSSPDTIATIGGFAIHVLPFVLFLTTLAQQKLTPTSADPKQKMMGYMMPAVMVEVKPPMGMLSGSAVTVTV